jgi:hypothetical protein
MRNSRRREPLALRTADGSYDKAAILRLVKRLHA